MYVVNCTGYEMLMEDIVSADGYYLYDSKEKKFMDFESGVWSISLGHNNKELNQEIKAQIDKIMHLGFRYTSEVIEKAASELISTLAPFSGKCVFLCSGSEAVELAVKAARYVNKDKKLLTFDLSYLSAYGSSGHKEDKDWYKLDLNQCMKCKVNNCITCKTLNEVPFENTSAFVFEPGNSSGLVLLPPKDLVQEIAKRVKEHGGLIVIDEVTTGVGRTGKWYGFQHYEMEPDIVAMGKGLGNGYPVSAVAFKDAVADAIQDGVFKHSQSHQNDALGCAVACKVIQIIKERDLINKSNENGQYLINKLMKLKTKTPIMKEVRGVGMMIGLELTEQGGTQLKKITDYLLGKGIIIGYNQRFNFIRFYPSLTTKREDIDAMTQYLEEALSAVHEEIK